MLIAKYCTYDIEDSQGNNKKRKSLTEPKARSAFGLIQKYAGQNFRYQEPTEDDVNLVYELALALDACDKEDNDLRCQNVMKILSALNMTVNKIPEDVDVFFFRPLVKGQLCFFWRFGIVAKPGEPSTYKNPVNPFIVSSLHEKTDGAGFIGLSEFFALNAKAMVINGLHAHAASKIPSPFQASRAISDGAHSPSTLTTPFLIALLRTLYPQAALDVVHGAGYYDRKTGKPKEWRLWFINSAAAPFELSKKSWPMLLTIAFAQTDFKFGEVQVSCRLKDHFIIDNKGIKRNLVSYSREYDGESVYRFVIGPCTDVQMHIVNNTNSIRSVGSDLGRGVHIEHGFYYQFDDPHLTKQQSHLISAFKQAGEWFLRWDDSAHNFADMPKNIREFSKWFDTQLTLLATHNTVNKLDSKEEKFDHDPLIFSTMLQRIIKNDEENKELISPDVDEESENNYEEEEEEEEEEEAQFSSRKRLKM